ncbi:MAG: hypothetical protein ACLSVP_07165 [Fusobacterium sp.]|jgi:hypothetical protein|nr:MAG TPA: lipoprotein [Caudoviricetes sp.]
MKKILLISFLMILTSCSNKQINGTPQTFTDYVILNKYSNYKGQNYDDWKKQPSENFPGIRLINWINQN